MVILTSVAEQVTTAVSSLIVGLISLALFGLLVFWGIRFLIEVPRHLKNIAELLEHIATKK